MLTDFWRDVIALLSVVLTTAGLIYAIIQIRKTKSAAEAAKESAQQTLRESQSRFQRYAAASANRFLNEAKIHVGHKDWDKASDRIYLVADQTNLLAAIAREWVGIEQELRKWATLCNRLALGESKRFPRKWSEFVGAIQGRLNETLGPTPRNGGASNDRARNDS